MFVAPPEIPFVVIVNDDESQLAFLAAMLHDEPVKVATFLSVAAALKAMHHQPPALIISDLYMPEIDGWTFCRMLRSAAYPLYNRTPILVLSATFSGDESGEIAAELGANDFLSMPVDGGRLRARVRALIETPCLPIVWKVLLVFASDREFFAVQSVFQSHGCHVHREKDVNGAATALAAEKWETVVCDVDMPGCSLQCLAGWVASSPRTSFVSVSANHDPALAVEAMTAGVGAHLRRPFAAEYLYGLCELTRQKNALIRAQRMLERRTTELRNSERLMESILNSSDQTYLVIDPAGRVELANQSARNLSDTMLDGVLRPGESVFDILPPGMGERVRESLKLVLLGRVVQHDVEVADRRGRPRRFALRYTPLKTADGHTEKICFNAQDITARTQTEVALRLRNHALSSISQGVVITDEKRVVTYANDTFLVITGYGRQEVLGRRVYFAEGAVEDSPIENLISRTLAANQPFHGEIMSTRKTGERYWNDLSVNPVKDAQGTTTQYVAVLRDITERKLQDEQLRASQGRLQALFDHSHDAILLADDSGRYIDVNPAACRLLGYSHEEMLKLQHGEIFGASDQGWSEGAWREFIEGGSQQGECTLVRKDRTSVRADYSAIARILPGLHLSIMRDISERHALQSQLFRQQRLESVGRLANGVAHDLNNILTPILMAPAMLKPHVTDAGARMLLEALESGARRGSAIVKQLLSFARSNPGEKVRLDLRSVLREACAIIRETFPKSIKLEAPLPPNEFLVLGDANQLQQVLVNLVLNAADAMPRGGLLAIALSVVESTRAESVGESDLPTGPHIVLTVADHGSGIPAAIIDKIFDPFFTTKPFGQGSGLGLSVVLGIVRDHGGAVRVSSRVGVGTIFKIHLPLYNPPAPVAERPPVPEAARFSEVGGGRVVLVVDDESGVRDIVRHILLRHGYRVICADGADAAFTQLQASDGRVDLVLTDVSMPGVSGAKFIEMLHGRRPDLPILVMTGNHASGALPPESLRLVRSVLSKPFDASTVVKAVGESMAPVPGLASG